MKTQCIWRYLCRKSAERGTHTFAWPSCWILDVLVWRLCYTRSFPSPLSLASHLLLLYWSWSSDLHPQVEVVDVSWHWGSLHARQHAEDPAMFTRHPHFSQCNVENMGLHHVHPQEAPPNGENGSKCSSVVLCMFFCVWHVFILQSPRGSTEAKVCGLPLL